MKDLKLRNALISGYDSDHEIEININGSCVYLEKSEVNELIRFLQSENKN